MVKMEVGPKMPENREGQLQHTFRYGIFGHRLEDYSDKNRVLSYKILSIESSWGNAYNAAKLIQYEWNQIRSAHKPKAKRELDARFDGLIKLTWDKYTRYIKYVNKCYPENPSRRHAMCDVDTREKINAAYRLLNVLCDESGFGNKLTKHMDTTAYAKRNMLE